MILPSHRRATTSSESSVSTSTPIIIAATTTTPLSSLSAVPGPSSRSASSGRDFRIPFLGHRPSKQTDPILALPSDFPPMSDRPSTSGTGTSSLRAFAARSFHLGRHSSSIASDSQPHTHNKSISVVANAALASNSTMPASTDVDGGVVSSVNTDNPIVNRMSAFPPEFVDFDDFHRSVTGTPDLSSFPIPSSISNASHERARQASSSANPPSRPASGIPRRSSLFRRSSDARRRGPSQSPSRYQSSFLNTSGSSVSSAAIPQPPSSYLNTLPSSLNAGMQHPPSLRPPSMPPSALGPAGHIQPTRKFSNNELLPASSHHDARSRRSSVMYTPTVSDLNGPVALHMENTGKISTSSRRRTMAHTGLLPFDGSNTLSNQPVVSIRTSLDPSKLAAPGSRKSMLTPSTPGKSPMRTSFHRTPASATNPTFSKRLSSMPYVGGLGARTISPTDARRLKRLSMATGSQGGTSFQIPSPSTAVKDTSFLDLTVNSNTDVPSLPSISDSSIRINLESAFPPPKKSTAPNSERSSPDSTKRNNSGASALATVNSSTLRSGSSRASFIAMSRLPTPKAQLHISGTNGPDEDDYVPPVPAIPKAYESPNDISTHDLFSSSMSPYITPSKAGPGSSNLDLAVMEPVFPSKPHGTASASRSSVIRHRRGLTIGASSEQEKPAPITSHVSKRALQALRLPPLNLLPLSTSTSERIAAFPDRPQQVPNLDGRLTPPPRRGAVMTPSTPLTASKAYFFQRSNTEEGDFSHSNRSSSRPIARAVTADFTSSMAISPTPPISIPFGNMIRQSTHTPFASASLPRTEDYLNRLSLDPMDDSSMLEEVPSLSQMSATAYRASSTANTRNTASRADPGQDTSFTTDALETPPSTTSAQRKLSFSYRRSSKSTINQTLTQQPSSSLSTEQLAASTLPTQARTREYPSHKASSAVSRASLPPAAVPGKPVPATNRKPTSFILEPSNQNVAARSSIETSGPKPSRILLPPASLSGISKPAALGIGSDLRPPRPKSSVPTFKTPISKVTEPHIDKDTAPADRIMERLGARHKDVEVAAHELDSLTLRATAKNEMTPAQAMQRFALNIFERGEIVDFDDVYFCGTPNAQKHVGDLHARNENFGYDDERGDYKIILGDHIAYRYEVIDVLGKGSFGQVVRCIDHKLGKLVAIKIIRNKKRFHQQALVEVNILQKLHEWDPEHKHSTIRFTQSMYFRGHLCISTELLGINLYEFIKAHDFKGFSLVLIRRFTKQILNALILLKSRRVIHCDLKPENILLCHPIKSEIKVIDFGSSCFENEKVYTYIQSRFYRSPEVILGMAYGLPIDMWSVGCIIAELLTGYPVFPGENEQEQLACIMEIFGPPEKHLIEKSSRRKVFFDSLGKPRVTVSSKGRRRRPSSKTLQQALRCDDEAFLDFISRCLRWDPDRRLKPDEAMHHEFLTGIKTPRPSTRGRFPLSSASMTSVASSTRDISHRVGGLTSSSPTKRVGGSTYDLPTRSSASRVTSKVAASGSGVGSSNAGPSTASMRQVSLGRPLPDLPPGSAHRHVSGSGPIAVTTRSPAKVSGHSRRHSAINMLGGMLKGVSSTSTAAIPGPTGGNRLGQVQAVQQPRSLGKNDLVGSTSSVVASARV